MSTKRILDPTGYPLRRGSVVVARVADDESVVPRMFVLKEPPTNKVEALNTQTYETFYLPLEETIVNVVLASNEYDLATDTDRLFEPGESSTLNYPLLVHFDLPTSLLLADVWRVIGWIDLDAREEMPRGLPIRGREDGRWQFTERELDELLPYQARAGRAFGDI